LISHEKCFRASEIWLITFQVVSIKQFAQFIALCSPSILAEMRGYAASFSSP
jgi:hypothetical protein